MCVIRKARNIAVQVYVYRRISASNREIGGIMIYFIGLENTLVRVVDNNEEIVGRIYDPKLLSRIICELNHEV